VHAAPHEDAVARLRAVEPLLRRRQRLVRRAVALLVAVDGDEPVARRSRLLRVRRTYPSPSRRARASRVTSARSPLAKRCSAST